MLVVLRRVRDMINLTVGFSPRYRYTDIGLGPTKVPMSLSFGNSMAHIYSEIFTGTWD